MNLNDSFNKRSAPSKAQSLTHYDTDGHTRNLCFAPSGGGKLFLSYAYLISGEFSSAENTITLTFTTHIVTLKGHNLADLFDGLAVQNLRHIAAVAERYAATEEETASLVTQIDVRNLP